MRSDVPIAVGVLLTYLGLVLFLLPGGTWPLMIGGALFLAGLTAVAARVWPGAKAPGGSVFVVSVVATLVLAAPNFPAMGGSYRAAVPLGFLGAQGIALLWLALRWPPWPRKSKRASLGEAVLFGAVAALMLSLVATVPIVIGLLVDASEVSPILWVYPAYFIGLTGAAVVYWLLQGVSHRPVGVYLIGTLAGMCLYGAVAPVVSIVDGEPIVLSELLNIATVCGVLVGPPVAMGIAKDS